MQKSQLPRIAIFVRALNVGGSERQALALANELARSGLSVMVISFYEGKLDHGLSGVEYHCLKKTGFSDWRFFFRFIRVLRQNRIGIVYSFLPNQNVVASLAKLFLPSLKIVWGIRSSIGASRPSKRADRVVERLQSAFSGLTDMVIFNSEHGRGEFQKKFIFKPSDVVIPNGVLFDQPLASAKDEINKSEILRIGMVGRLDPIKDHPLF